MTQINSISSENNAYIYNKDLKNLSDETKEVSLFESNTDKCTDGNDDGKLGAGEILENTAKGALDGLVNGIKGMFLDEEGNFSLGNTLKTAAMGAACFIPGIGPVVAGALCTAGAVTGAAKTVQGIAGALSAQTDAEAKASFQQIGGGALQTGLSVAGAKASAKAIAKNANVSKLTSGSGNKLVNAAKNTIEGATNYYKGESWTGAIKKGASGTVDNILNIPKAIGEKADNIKNKLTKKSGTISDKKMQKLIKKGKVTEVTADDGSTYYTQQTGRTTQRTYAQKAGTEGKQYSYTTQDTRVESTYATAKATETKELAYNDLADDVKAGVDGMAKGETREFGTTRVKALGDNRYKVTTETGADKIVKQTTTTNKNAREAYNAHKQELQEQGVSLKDFKNGGEFTLEDGTTIKYDPSSNTASTTTIKDSNAFMKRFGEINGFQDISPKGTAFGLVTSNMKYGEE